MPYVMVDIEADGPIPGDFSMISFGAIVVERPLDRVFSAPPADRVFSARLQHAALHPCLASKT